MIELVNKLAEEESLMLLKEELKQQEVEGASEIVLEKAVTHPVDFNKEGEIFVDRGDLLEILTFIKKN